jgi:transcriptional regulator with XRE-family HTH domain
MRNMNVNSIGEYIREQREQAKISMRQLAQSAGVSNPYLSQIERGLRKPSADILQQIAKGLRISAEALYVQAGILEDRTADSGVRSALLADPQLSERQKQVLIEIYESFRRENAAVTQTAADADDPGDPAELTGGEPGAEADVLEAAAMEAAAMEAAAMEAMQAEAAEAAQAEAEAAQAEARQAKAPRTKAGRAKATWAEATQAEAGAEPAQASDPAGGLPDRTTQADQTTQGR